MEQRRRGRIGARMVPALLMLWAIAGARTASAADWPPVDPQAERAKVAFDRTWAIERRDVRDFADLQRAAGAGGRIESYALTAPFPRVLYGWTGSDGTSRMRAFLYADGAFSATISPSPDAPDITLNSFGAFVCPGCDPPVSACGHRPSWIPHDVHWDTFDCARTLTGPMIESR